MRMALNNDATNTMTDTTLVAAFSNHADAQAAATELETAGINRSNIYLESSSSAGVTSGTSNSYSSRTSNHEGGVAGWFKSLFGAEEGDTGHAAYGQTLEQGGYVLSVDTNDQDIDRVESILNRHNPVNIISEDDNAYTSTSTSNFDGKNLGATSAAGTSVGEGETIPVVQEDLRVGKRSVLRGGVRVVSRIVETPVQENIGLREEHVHVNRQAVNRPATEADFVAGRSQSIELEEYAEEAVVAKDARVVEEIHVGKDVSERNQTVTDSVRHTEVEVEEIPAGDRTRATTPGR